MKASMHTLFLFFLVFLSFCEVTVDSIFSEAKQHFVLQCWMLATVNSEHLNPSSASLSPVTISQANERENESD